MKDKCINVAEAKRRFSELIGRVSFGGERIVISKRGKPVAVLLPPDKAEAGLASVRGWLDNRDPFFAEIDRIVRNRRRMRGRTTPTLENR